MSDKELQVVDGGFEARLNSIDGFMELSELSKRIIFERISCPDLTIHQIATKLGAKAETVRVTLNTKTFEKINYMIAELSIKDLLHLAIKTLRISMLCPSPAVRLAAAMAVLRNADLMKDKPEVVKQDNKFVIVWGGEKAVQNSVQNSVGTILNGNPNPIYSPLETAGDTRLNGKV